VCTFCFDYCLVLVYEHWPARPHEEHTKQFIHNRTDVRHEGHSFRNKNCNVKHQCVITLWTVAPRLLRTATLSTSTLRVYVWPQMIKECWKPAILVTSSSSALTLELSPLNSCKNDACVPVVPFTPRNLKSSLARRNALSSISNSWSQRHARLPTVVSWAGLWRNWNQMTFINT
jgi:hypothetical protein